MKRSCPPKRKTALKRSAPLRSATAQRRRPGKRRSNGVPGATRALVEGRDGGRCEAGFTGCGGRGSSVHHRKLRRSGDHRPVNLVHLCSHCHTTVIHGNPEWAYAHGWLVRQDDRPEDVVIRNYCEPGCSC